MNWKSNHSYKAKLNYEIEFFSLKNLIYNYQTLVGASAVALYNFLYLEATNSVTNTLFLSQDRIIKMTHFTKEELDILFSKLELFSLIEIYFSSDEDRVIYVLNRPLGFNEISKDFIYEYLPSKIGYENLKINEIILSFTHDQSISKQFEKQAPEIRFLNDSESQSNKELKQRLNARIDYSFLFKILESQSIDYSSFWTSDLEQLFTQAILVYELNFLDIYLIVKDLLHDNLEINLENVVSAINYKQDLNQTWLEKSLKNKNSNFQKINLLKNLTPQQFLNLRFGRKLNSKEEKLLSDLKTHQNLTDEMMNIILDFTISKDNNSLHESMILKIVNSIARVQIRNALDLIDFLRKIRSNKDFNDYYASEFDSLDNHNLMNEISEDR